MFIAILPLVKIPIEIEIAVELEHVNVERNGRKKKGKRISPNRCTKKEREP